MASLWLLFCLLTASYASNILQLELLAESLEGSKCLDGSQAGFYYQAPVTSAGDSLFVINLEGGGHCITEQSCKQRAMTNLGSSKYWKQTMEGSGSYSNSPAENPDFYDAHHIFVPYCCGDWHTGRVKEATSATWNLYFDGHYIIHNILDVLISKYKILNATHILIGGQSAGFNYIWCLQQQFENKIFGWTGGIGTFQNLDFIADYLNVSENEIIIKGVPNSGWFFSANTSDQQSEPMMPPNGILHVHSSLKYIACNDRLPALHWDGR